MFGEGERVVGTSGRKHHRVGTVVQVHGVGDEEKIVVKWDGDTDVVTSFCLSNQFRKFTDECASGYCTSAQSLSPI